MFGLWAMPWLPRRVPFSHVSRFFFHMYVGSYIHLLLICYRYVSSGNPTGLCRSSRLRVADFSYNFFVGSVPKCLDYLPRYLIPLFCWFIFLLYIFFSHSGFVFSSSFRGNCFLDRDPKQRPTLQCGMFLYVSPYYCISC